MGGVLTALAVLPLLAGCAWFTGAPAASPAPQAGSVQDRCEAQTDRDPAVLDMQMKMAGNLIYQQNELGNFRRLKTSLTQKCLAANGAAPRGGVEAVQH